MVVKLKSNQDSINFNFKNMKNYRNFSYVLFLFLVLLNTSILRTSAQEFLLIDKTFTWDENIGGDGCYGYHFWYDLGEAPTTNWKTPYDYQNGLFYIRYEIISQPQLPGGGYQPFGISFCIWADRGFEVGKWKESCATQSWFTGPGSVVVNTSSPSSWWNHPNGGVDWTALDKLWRFGNPFWIDGSCQLASAFCTCAPESVWNTERGKYLPMDIRLTIVAVAQGYSFSGWDYYLNGGGVVLRQPTPSYGIDYYSERTNKVVPSTDEYSYSSNMSGAVSGNGTALTLTAGQNVYFRKKANGDTLASEIQTLSVPSQPSAPTFTWDNTNQRTSTVVSSDYEYSSSSDMSGAVSGTGTYVSIPAGNTKYFRKKANSGAFKSKIQTLQGVAITDIGPEFVILNETIDYPNASDTNGFYFFYYNSSMPSNWITPTYDYYNGQIYTRYEIISQSTSTAVGLQFGIWQKLPVGTGTLYESMADIKTLNGPGSVVTANSSPSSYWTYNGGVDYTQMDKVWHFGINPWKVSPSNYQIRQENASVWSERYTYWFPMKVKVTVVAVASGHTFSGWSNYILTKAPTPTYGIDYTNELTDKVVPSTDEYSVNSNMSGAVSGTGQKITLTPGQNCYFRTKASGSVSASDIQTLTVPARPAAPAFSIDYQAENTNTTVSSDYIYSTQSNMSSPTSGTGVKVTLTPGTNLYLRKKPTAGAFSSEIQTLTVASRPTAPGFTVDYANERTIESVTSSYAYSVNADMSSATTGSGTKPAITPGTNLYFRKLSTVSEFASSIQTLTVNARPAAPSFAIDFVNENTAVTITSDYEHADNLAMTGAVSGTGIRISLVPGTNKYFRKKATASAFKSAIQTLAVPARPAAPAFTIDYSAETTTQEISSEYEYSTAISMTGAVTGNGSKLAVVPGTNLYFRGKPTATQFVSEIQTLVVADRPLAPSYTINFADETTNEAVFASDEYDNTLIMAGAVAGTGVPVALTPGNDIYFRVKTTGSAFSGNIQQLVVPARPSFDASVTDTVTGSFFLVAIELDGDAAGFSAEDIETVNCSLVEVTSLIFKVIPVQKGPVNLKIKANAVDAGNFASDELAIYYKPSQSGFGENEINAGLTIYPSPVKDELEVSLLNEKNDNVQVSIWDMYGRQMIAVTFRASSASIDCSGLPNGIYLVRCTLPGQEIIRKIIKE